MQLQRRSSRPEDRQGSQAAVLQGGIVSEDGNGKSGFFNKMLDKSKRSKTPRRKTKGAKKTKTQALKAEIAKLQQALEQKNISANDAEVRLRDLKARIEKIHEIKENEAEMFTSLSRHEKGPIFQILDQIVKKILLYTGASDCNYVGVCRYRDEEDQLRGIAFSELGQLDLAPEVMERVKAILKKMTRKKHQMNESLSGKVIAENCSIRDPTQLEGLDIFHDEVKEAGLIPVVSLRVRRPDSGDAFAAITIYEIKKEGSTAHNLTERQVDALHEYLDSGSISVVLELGAHREIERREHARLLDEQAKVARLLKDQVLSEWRERHRVVSAIRCSLPKSFSLEDGVDIYAYYDPARTIGGDFYYFQKVGNNVVIWLGDAAGKGIGGAIAANLAQYALKDILASKDLNAVGPSEVLQELNHKLYQFASLDTQFISCFLCIINSETGEVTYASAGHDPVLLYTPADPLSQILHNISEVNVDSIMSNSIVSTIGTITSPNGSVTELRATGLSLAIFDSSTYDQQTLVLRKGQKAVKYTDGFTDARNKEGEMFGIERLMSCVEQYGHLPAQELRDRIVEAVIEFVGIPVQVQHSIREISEDIESTNLAELLATYKSELKDKSSEEILAEISEIVGPVEAQRIQEYSLNSVKNSQVGNIVSKLMRTHYSGLEGNEYFEKQEKLKSQIKAKSSEEIAHEYAVLYEKSIDEIKNEEVGNYKATLIERAGQIHASTLEDEYANLFRRQITEEVSEYVNISADGQSGFTQFGDTLHELLKGLLNRSRDDLNEIPYYEILGTVLNFLPHNGKTDDMTLLVLEKN